MKSLRASISKRLARLQSFPALVRRRGATFLLDPQDWIDNRLIADVPFENAQVARCHELIAGHRLDTFLDIGANFGLYTVLIGTHPSIKRVHAFEPVRRNFAQLMGNVFVNRISDSVTAHRVGLGSAAVQTTIHIDPRSHGLSRLDLTDAERDTSVFSHSETIEIVRLDDILDLRGQRCLVKIDVEGFASNVIDGMAGFLAQNTVVLQIEILAGESDPVTRKLSELGYESIGAIDRDCYFASQARKRSDVEPQRDVAAGRA